MTNGCIHDIDDWIAATETMTLTYTETAGGAADKIHIAMKYEYIDTP